jgi:hypothetical protein
LNVSRTEAAPAPYQGLQTNVATGGSDRLQKYSLLYKFNERIYSSLQAEVFDFRVNGSSTGKLDLLDWSLNYFLTRLKTDISFNVTNLFNRKIFNAVRYDVNRVETSMYTIRPMNISVNAACRF